MKIQTKITWQMVALLSVIVFASGCASETKTARPSGAATIQRSLPAAQSTPSPTQGTTAKLCKGCSCPGTGEAHKCTCGPHMGCML